MKKVWALMLSLLIVAGMLAACDNSKVTNTGVNDGVINDKVLVIGVDATFDEKWNPFQAESSYDMQVLKQIFTPIMQLNAENEMVPHAGEVTSKETDDGGVLYTVKINKGMKYSDETPITIDDYIWAIYVRSDPTFTGLSSTIATFIEGVAEYYYDDPNYSQVVEGFAAEAAAYGAANINLERWMEYAIATDVGGEWPGDVEGAIEYITEEGEEARLEGVDTADEAAVFDVFAEMIFDLYAGYFDVEAWKLAELNASYATGNLEDGIDVPEISGVTKIDDYTCTVKYTKVDIMADRGLALENGMGWLIPSHYYGEYTKGDVTQIMSNFEPMGSGPYVWAGFADNIATCTANNGFFLAKPATGTVRWQFIPQPDIVENILSGAIDISNPSCNENNVNQLSEGGADYTLIDNAGYGHMGINTERVPLNIRKAMFHLMNRSPAVEAYYADRAMVIERPMTTVVPEYPHDATEYYGYDLDKVLEYIEAEGYKKENGKLMKDGQQLSVNVYVGGSGIGDHPAYPMLTQARDDLASLGGELIINDSEFSVLTSAVENGTADMWIMAWGSAFDCDKSSQFHSKGSQNVNRYRYSDPAMDDILETIVQTVDFNERKDLVAQMLDMAMDAGLELPIYQRKNMLAYNSNNLNMDTIPEATAFYDYQQVLYQVETLS